MSASYGCSSSFHRLLKEAVLSRKPHELPHEAAIRQDRPTARGADAAHRLDQRRALLQHERGGEHGDAAVDAGLAVDETAAARAARRLDEGVGARKVPGAARHMPVVHMSMTYGEPQPHLLSSG